MGTIPRIHFRVRSSSPFSIHLEPAQREIQITLYTCTCIICARDPRVYHVVHIIVSLFKMVGVCGDVSGARCVGHAAAAWHVCGGGGGRARGTIRHFGFAAMRVVGGGGGGFSELINFVRSPQPKARAACPCIRVVINICLRAPDRQTDGRTDAPPPPGTRKRFFPE